MRAIIHEHHSILPNGFAQSRILRNKNGFVMSWGDAINMLLEKQGKARAEMLRQDKLKIEVR